MMVFLVDGGVSIKVEVDVVDLSTFHVLSFPTPLHISYYFHYCKTKRKRLLHDPRNS
jgi:hypothetical protein